MSGAPQAGSATIARLACRYALPRVDGDRSALREQLDRVLRSRLADAVASALDALDDVDPEGVWLIRSLRTQVTVSARVDDLDLLARQWGTQLADAILNTLRAGPGGNVVRFSSRAAHLAAFAAALAARSADGWLFEAFAGLRPLSPSAAIRAGAAGAAIRVADVVAELARTRRLEAVISASTPVEVASLWAACLVEAGAAPPTIETTERVRALDAVSAGLAEVAAPASERALRLFGVAALRLGTSPDVITAAAAVATGGAPAPGPRSVATGDDDGRAAAEPAPVDDSLPATSPPRPRVRPHPAVAALVFAAHGAQSFLVLPSLLRLGLDASGARARGAVLARMLGLPVDEAIELAAGMPSPGEEIEAQALLRTAHAALAADDRLGGGTLVTEVVRLEAPPRRIAVVRDAASNLVLAGAVRTGPGGLPWRALVERAAAAARREPDAVVDASAATALRPLHADLAWLDPVDDDDLAVALVAHAALRDLARRLPGFDRSSLPYLVERFLPPGGVVAANAARIHAELPRPPLAVILTMAGLDRFFFRVPWLEPEVLVTHRGAEP